MDRGSNAMSGNHFAENLKLYELWAYIAYKALK